MLITTSGSAPDIAGVGDFIARRQDAVDSGELAWFEEAEIDGVTSSFGNVAAAPSPAPAPDHRTSRPTAPHPER